MRKTFVGILAAIIVSSFATTSASAASLGIGCSGNFVDADGDGVCDNYMAGQAKGYRQGKGLRGACGRNFADADGDGVCDNYIIGQAGGNRQECGFRGGRGR